MPERSSPAPRSPYGADIRARVQQTTLGALSCHGNAGSQLETFLDLTRHAVDGYRRKNARNPGGVEITFEMYLAVVLLIKLQAS
jgi:hypothetical protein